MFDGAVAQLGEHLLCKQGVTGSIPVSSTKFQLKFQYIFSSLYHAAIAGSSILTSLPLPGSVSCELSASLPCRLDRMRLRAQRSNRASKIFDNRIDWVVVTTRLSGTLAFELECQQS